MDERLPGGTKQEQILEQNQRLTPTVFLYGMSHLHCTPATKKAVLRRLHTLPIDSPYLSATYHLPRTRYVLQTICFSVHVFFCSGDMRPACMRCDTRLGRRGQAENVILRVNMRTLKYSSPCYIFLAAPFLHPHSTVRPDLIRPSLTAFTTLPPSPNMDRARNKKIRPHR